MILSLIIKGSQPNCEGKRTSQLSLKRAEVKLAGFRCTTSLGSEKIEDRQRVVIESSLSDSCTEAKEGGLTQTKRLTDCEFSGGADGDRTHDLVTASYTPMKNQ